MEIDLSGPLQKAYEKAKSQYLEAIQNNDVMLARSKALECSAICKQLAKAIPRKKDQYLSLVVSWENRGKESFAPIPEPSHEDSKKKFITIQKSEKKFNDIAGLDSVKEIIKECIVYPFKYPNEYKYFGVNPGGGILLYGPPGCGKTLLAAAAAGECGTAFISVRMSDIRDKFVGESEKNIRAVFEAAKEYESSIIFFDEIDALGGKRSDNQELHERTLINELLSQMDGLEKKSESRQILILAATNRPWDLDLALRRPGRFDTAIFIPHPDFESRKQLFEITLRNRPVSSVDTILLAEMTDGYSSAEIVNICQNAAKIPLRELIHESKERRSITNDDFIKAILSTQPSLNTWYSNARSEIEKSAEIDAFQDLMKEAEKSSPQKITIYPDDDNQQVPNPSEEIILKTDIKSEVIKAILAIAKELSDEGREGRHVGTSFIVGDAEVVLAKSRQLVLNPFQGHNPDECKIQNPELKENIKEFAQLDGAFVITGEGVVIAAGRYITVDASMTHLIKGLGTRHSSVAAITQATNAIGVVVSQSGGRIRVFKGGKIIM